MDFGWILYEFCKGFWKDFGRIFKHNLNIIHKHVHQHLLYTQLQIPILKHPKLHQQPARALKGLNDLLILLILEGFCFSKLLNKSAPLALWRAVGAALDTPPAVLAQCGRACSGFLHLGRLVSRCFLDRIPGTRFLRHRALSPRKCSNILANFSVFLGSLLAHVLALFC